MKYSTKISVASQFSPGAADYFTFGQAIEGQNIIDFQMGSAGAATIVTSQWIKGSVAGTYAVQIKNATNARSYIGTISVTTAWQRLSINFVGDTTGTWATDTAAGMYIVFDLGSGSNFNGTAGAWQAGNVSRTSGSVTFVNQVNGSTLNITGVQVEAVPTGATTPTAFEFLPYETQLRRARRYNPVFNAGGASSKLASGGFYSTSSAQINFVFDVVPRTIPSGVVSTTAGNFTLQSAGGVAGSAATSITLSGVSSFTAGVVNVVGTGTPYTIGQAADVLSNNGQVYFTGPQL